MTGLLRVVTAAAVLAAAACALPSSLSAQSTHLLVVTGLGGSPEYSARFATWGAGLVDAAAVQGVPASNVVWLAERESMAPGVDGPARAGRVAAELAALADRAAPGDLVVVAIFGHGSARGGESRVNLPGPDLTAPALAAMLDDLGARRVAVVNAASASGGFVEAVSAPGRVVITATRSPGEAEAARFGGHFVAAFAGAGADVDRDGDVSLLEAFEYARREVAREFAQSGHLPTEHALLDDDGDGVGSLEPALADGGDGRLAAGTTLAPATVAAPASPEVAALRARQASLRSELESLRSRETEMEEAAYQAELERLFLEIARTGRALREAGGAEPDAGGAL